MAQVFDFKVNIEQVKQQLAELAALEREIFGTAPPPVANFANVAPPTFPAALEGVSEGDALAKVARVQAAVNASIKRVEAQSLASPADVARLRTASAGLTGGTAIPYTLPTNAVSANPAIGNDEMRAANAAYRNATNSLSAAKTSEAEFAQRSAEEAARGLTTQEQVNAGLTTELLEEEEVNKALAQKNAAIRKSIVQLEAQLGLPVTQGGPAGASLSDLNSVKSTLAAQRAAQQKVEDAHTAALYQEQIKSLSRSEGYSNALGQSQLTGTTPATFAPTAALRRNAQQEAIDMAAERQIAVAYGHAKQEAYYDQIRFNNVFRTQFAEEQALREARLGIQKQLVAEELGRVRPDGTRLRDDVVKGKVADDVEATVQAADVNAAKAANDEYIAAKSKSAIAHETEAASIAEANALNPEFAAAKVRNIEAQALETIAIQESTTEKTIQLQAQVAAGNLLTREQVKAAEFEALATSEAAAVKAQRIIAEKEYNIAVNKALAEELATRGYSKFQQSQALQGKFNASGAPQDAAGLFGGGLINTVKYALPSLALFAGAAGLAKSIKEAQELQKVFAQITAQAESLGQSSGVAHLKDSILDIAAASGTASPEVANLAFQFQGAFGGDTQKTIDETRSAIEAVTVTGLSLKETTDAFTALTQSFKNEDVTISQISDTALGLQERFGVLAKETISFAADLAPVGAQIGATSAELETLGAVAQKYSGKSGTQLADAFGRIFPQMQKNAVDVIAIFDTLGNKDIGKKLSQEFATGQSFEAFKTLGESYNQLSEAQQNLLIQQLGGRREAQALIPVLEHYNEIIDSNKKGLGDAGKTTEYYTVVQATLSRQLAVLGENLKQIGIKIFEGGLGDALNVLVAGGRGIVEIFGGAFKVVSALNEALGGIPITALSVLAAIRLLGGAANIATTAFSRLIAAKTVDSEVSAVDQVANERQAASFAGTTTATNTAAGSGFFGSIIANTKTNYAAARGVELRDVGGVGVKSVGQAGAFGGPELLAEEGLFAANMSKSAGGLGRFGVGIEKAATGVGAFAESLPSGLVFAAAVIAVGALVTTINDIRSKAAEQQGALDQKILNEADPVKRERMLQQLAHGQTYDAYDQARGFVTGYKSPEDEANQIRAQLSVPGVISQLSGVQSLVGEGIGTKQIAAGVVTGEPTGGNTDSVKELQRAIDDLKSDPSNIDKINKAKHFIEVYNHEFGGTSLGGNVTVASMLAKDYDAGIEYANAEKQKRQSADQKKKDLSEKFNTLTTDISQIKNSISSGDISTGEGLARINQTIAIYDQLQKDDPNALSTIEGAAGKYAEAKKARAELLSKSAYEDAQSQIKFNELSANRDDPSANVAALEKALKSGQLTPADQQKATDQLMSAYKDLYAFRLKNANSAEEQANTIANGIPIAPEARSSLIKQQLDVADRAFQDFIGTQDVGVQTVLGDSTGAISELMVSEGVSLEKATVMVLQAKAAILRAGAKAQQSALDLRKANGETGTPIDDAQRQIDDLNKTADSLDKTAQDVSQNHPDLGKVEDPGAVIGGEEDNRKAAAERRKAENEYYKALNSGDAVAAAQADLASATADLADTKQGTLEWLAAAATVAQDQATLKNALLARQKAHFSYLKALQDDDPVGQAQVDVQAAGAALAASTPDNIDENRAAYVSAQNQLKHAAEAVGTAQLEYYKQLYSDDPIQAGNIALQIAQKQLAEAKPNTAAWFQAAGNVDAAQKAQRQAEEALQDARLDYAAALVAGDPVKAAKVAQDKAKLHLSEAKNETERLKALAEKLNADRSLQKALSDLYASQSDLVKASADYLGDTVKSANISLDEAKRKLAEVEAQYGRGDASEADVNKAKADVIRATGQQRDSVISKRRDDLAFQFEMGQITKSQYIAYLEGLKSLADGNQSIIRDLDRQIKGLKDQLGADLQFNLPTNLALPTLYEARRLNQSSGPNGQAAGYQDNRNVQVNIVVNNGMDVQQVKTVLSDTLGGGRYGNSPRRY